MPIWTMVYCGLVSACGIFVIATRKKEQAHYYVPGEVLSVLCCCLMFMLAYQVINLPNPKLIATVMLSYFIYWEGWENRHYYDFKHIQQDIASSISEDEPLNNQTSQQIAKYWVLSIKIMVVLFISPVIFVFGRIIMAY